MNANYPSRPSGLTVPAPSSRYILPQFEERTSYGMKRTDPYTKLFEDRIIFLGVQVDDASADDVIAQLIVLESQDPDRDILMYINSPGGSFTAMTAIYDTMQYIRPDVQTFVVGQAASAAAVLLGAGAKGKRYALPNARVLIHQPAIEGTGGMASDLEIHANEVLRMRGWLEDTIAHHADRDVELVRKDIERDKILSAAPGQGVRPHRRGPRLAQGRARGLSPAPPRSGMPSASGSGRHTCVRGARLRRAGHGAPARRHGARAACGQRERHGRAGGDPTTGRRRVRGSGAVETLAGRSRATVPRSSHARCRCSAPVRPGALRLASDLRRSGIEPSRGGWHHVRRGVWVDAGVWATLDATQRYAAFTHADGPAPPARRAPGVRGRVRGGGVGPAADRAVAATRAAPRHGPARARLRPAAAAPG